MNIRKILLIAKREYWFNFRRRSFLFTAFVIPLITFGGLFVVFNLLNQTLEDISSYKNIGIVDQASVFDSTTLPAPFKLIASEDQAAVDLQSKALDGYYVLGSDFLSTGQVRTYNRQELTLNEAINDKFTDALKAGLASKLGDANLVTRLVDPLADTTIYRLGSDQPLDESALLGSFFVPFIFVKCNDQLQRHDGNSSQFIMSGLAEEKETA
ncbi:MAG: hypothetical protein U0528_08115 [Anaerolineae bacterium]